LVPFGTFRIAAIDFDAGCPCPRPPSSGFGYPRDGFIPPNPGRFYFAPAAPLGFALRSVLLAPGCRGVSTARRTRMSLDFAFYSTAEAAAPAREIATSGVMPGANPLLSGAG